MGDVAPGLVVVGVLTLPHALHLQVQEEPLHHRDDAPMSSGARRIGQIGQDE